MPQIFKSTFAESENLRHNMINQPGNVTVLKYR